MVQKWLVLCSMLWSIPAFACKCNHQDIESSFKSADFVFVANIYSTVNEFPGLQQNNPILLSRAKIVKSYKSPSEFSFYQTKEVTLLSSSLDTCDYPFVAHGKYLIFGFLDSDSEFVYSSHCLSTKALSEVSRTELVTLSRLADEYEIENQTIRETDDSLIEIVEFNSNRKMNSLLLENSALTVENNYLKYSLILLTVLAIIIMIYKVNKKGK